MTEKLKTPSDQIMQTKFHQ